MKIIMQHNHTWKYKCISEGTPSVPDATITFETSGDITLTDMLSLFEDYLSAVGFIIDGHLEMVDDSNTTNSPTLVSEPPPVNIPIVNSNTYGEPGFITWNENDIQSVGETLNYPQHFIVGGDAHLSPEEISAKNFPMKVWRSDTKKGDQNDPPFEKT